MPPIKSPSSFSFKLCETFPWDTTIGDESCILRNHPSSSLFVSTCPVLPVQKWPSFGGSEGAKALAEGAVYEDPVGGGEGDSGAGGEPPGLSAAQGWLCPS